MPRTITVLVEDLGGGAVAYTVPELGVWRAWARERAVVDRFVDRYLRRATTHERFQRRRGNAAAKE